MALTFKQIREGVNAPTVSRYIPAAGDDILIRQLSKKRVKEIMGENDVPTPEQSAQLLCESLADDDDGEITPEQALAMMAEVDGENPPLVFKQIIEAVGDVIKGEGAEQGES